MGKVRRYKKKLAKVAAGTNDTAGQEEQPQQTDYLELAEELLSLKKDDDKMSVCSVMKSIKSSGGGESIKLKKNAKRCLKHAFLLKSRLQLDYYYYFVQLSVRFKVCIIIFFFFFRTRKYTKKEG